MLIILFLVLLFFLGLEITFILRVKMNLAERLAVSYLLGIGILTFAVFLLDFVFNINFCLNNTFSVLVSLCAILFAFEYKKTVTFFKDIRFEKKSLKPKTLVFWGFILAIFAFTLLVNSFWPISDWDALALYDFRAKVFLVDTNLVHAAQFNSYFIQYPLLTSLSHLFVYQVGLGNPKFIYSLFYLSFIVIFYYSLRKKVSENKAILFTVILFLMPETFSNATMAYTNLPYMVYLCSGTFYLYDWIKKKERPSLLLSAFLVGLSSWVRITELFWLAPILIVLVVAFKNKRWKELIYYPTIILLFYLSWKIFINYICKTITPILGAIGLSYISILKEINFERILSVINYLYTYVFSSWGLIFLLFLIVIIKAAVNWKRNNNVFLYITLLFFALLFAGTLLFSITYPGWQDIPDSVRRMSMFLLPMIVFSASLSV